MKRLLLLFLIPHRNRDTQQQKQQDKPKYDTKIFLIFCFFLRKLPQLSHNLGLRLNSVLFIFYLSKKSFHCVESLYIIL